LKFFRAKSNRAVSWPAILAIPLVAILLGQLGFADAADGRPDIVFLFGNDAEGAGFFAAARSYYRDTDPTAKVIARARSLEQVREELSHRAGDHPWGQIILVAHGTQWTGLAVPLFTDSGPATLSSIRKARLDGEFPPLPTTAIDDDTMFVVESCGLGRRPDYIHELAALFTGGDGAHAQISASRNLVWFGLDSASNASERRELEYSATILSGKATGTRLATAKNALHSQLSALHNQPQTSEVILPVHVHIAAAASGLDRAGSVQSYVGLIPTGKVDLAGAGLAANSFVWRRQDHGASVDLLGEATLVLVMQSVPNMDAPVVDTPNFSGALDGNN
jgi:hypothetical protein